MATNAITLKKLLTNFTYSVVDIKKITPIILHYRWFILGVSSGVMSATSLLAITTKPTYQSYMQILVSYNSDELSPTNHREKTTKDLNKPQLSSIDYSSQIKLMLSDKLVQKAVNLLHGDYPQMTVEDIYSNSQIDQVSSLPPTQLPADSEVNQHSNQTFLLSFTDKDPLRTKRVLQALEKVYKDYNIYQKDQRINQGLVFVNKHLPQLQQDVLKAEKKLETFRKQNNLIDPVLQSQILLQSLADIQKQRQTTRAQLQDVQAQHNSLEQAIASSNQNKKNINDSFQTRQNQSLISELTQTFEALKEARIVYTEKHPIIQKLVQKQQIIITLLQQEEKNKAITINSKSKISEQRVPKLENDLTKLKITALGLIAHDQDLVKSEQEIRSLLSNYPSLITEYNNLVANVETYRKRLQQLVQIQNSLGVKIAQEGFNWQILEEPALGIHIGNLRWLLIIGGVVMGPILGLAAALLWERCNHAIFYTQDLQNLTNVQLLGSVPRLGTYRNSWQRQLQSMVRDKSKNVDISNQETIKNLPNHETLDIIYQNIQILNNSLNLKSLMLTSALPGEGKTTLALGLGASAARMHQRVLVIDANLRSPSLHKTLGLSNDWGLSLLLVDDINTSFRNYIQPIHPAIDILTAGPVPEDAVNLLSSERMQELMDLFTQNYDLVLIDAPSVLDTVDGRIMASLCNGIVMIGRIGKVTPNKLMEATEILSKLNLIGIIGNEVYDFPQILTP
ncbi:polysaccharide biosynthesis tyrosine autokinase [Dolichospermum sp. ST_sed1]|nr:polysaccharide biosynthesis tyrosine autokinase [Dolichospermum sp. ST_sed1]MDD1425864.1 polysaccharide biosynthesis tyrosine autokinase [Dolichospermum sp. ST_sed9]MDD1433969.1 polysaccharide biosynthesis tyrosine autokinase [Dolichospermum sp. ST_sed6]MDD1437716.1 polysaccharide biosynthesis tyrosine autokinase [Dolichospermum sp. ST_sed10]MDD1441309.1 polysaccharide biosynthesis tyrosine autokinase [Dolichospermum sp. ST_sed3]MDD1448964.1 polysaccharide biosynthesis tyrosine autokinase [